MGLGYDVGKISAGCLVLFVRVFDLRAVSFELILKVFLYSPFLFFAGEKIDSGKIAIAVLG